MIARTHPPAAIRQFQPTLFQDGDAFCCILGSNPQAGVFGCGNTAEDALTDWDKHFHELLANQYAASEEVKQYVNDTYRRVIKMSGKRA